MSKRRGGLPPYRPRRTIQGPTVVADSVVGDAIATSLIDMQAQLRRIGGRLDRMDGRLDRMDDRFVGIEGRLDGIDLSLREIRADVHVLTVWKERVFGVIIACGAFAAMLAFTINIIKLLDSRPP